MPMDAARKPSGRMFADTRESWPLMNAYQRFEQIVALVLSAIIAVVVVIAALAGSTLVLGIVYWLLRDRDDRRAALDATTLGGARATTR